MNYTAICYLKTENTICTLQFPRRRAPFAAWKGIVPVGGSAHADPMGISAVEVQVDGGPGIHEFTADIG